MSDLNEALRKGLYKTVNETPVTLVGNNRTIKIKMVDGTYADVPDPDYVRRLEQQILDLTKKVDIQSDVIKRIDAEMLRQRAAIKKLDSRVDSKVDSRTSY